MKLGPLIAAALPWLTALLLAPPERHLRDAERAWQRGDRSQALDRYRLAELRTTDPGLVAYNEGVVLEQLGDLEAAVEHFQRSRQDATGQRRQHLLFNLGNTLTRLAFEVHQAHFDEAIAVYEECLRELELPPALEADVRHNLELARLLKATKKDQRPNPRERPNDSDGNSKGNRRQKVPGDRGADGNARPTRGKAEPGMGDASGDPQSTEEYAPGKGNLPPIPDTDERAPLLSVEATEHLRLAADRIQRDQLEHRRQQAAAARRGQVKDW